MELQLVRSCTGCGGRSVLLQTDGVYYFVSCEQCEKSGPRGGAPEEALDLWNNESSTLFEYGEDLRRSRILKRLECHDQREERCLLEVPVVMAVGGIKGRRVTGVMRNVSNYGAYFELTGGEMSAIPVDMEEFAALEIYAFFKLPKSMNSPSGTSQGIQRLQFSPRHMHQRREILGIGGCFVQMKKEQAEMLYLLVKVAGDMQHCSQAEPSTHSGK